MSLPETKRNHALDFVKVLATTFILFHHYQQISGVQYTNHPNFYKSYPFNWAWMVEVFFVLSGFFTFSKSTSVSSTFGSYLSGKLKRLLPVVACSVIVYCGLNYLHMVIYQKPWFFPDIPNVWGVIVSSLGLQTGLGFNGYALNNPMWFVSVLIQCYCFAYVFIKLSSKMKWPLGWILFFWILTTVSLRTNRIELPFLSEDAQRGYISFATGGLVALFVSKYRINRPVKLTCAACLISFIAFITIAPAYIEVESFFVFLVCPSMVILLQTDTAKSIFRFSLWRRLSEISFNTYVWHLPLQLFLALAAPEIVYSHKVGHMYLFALLAWITGTASCFLLERPLRKWIPKAISKLLVKR